MADKTPKVYRITRTFEVAVIALDADEAKEIGEHFLSDLGDDNDLSFMGEMDVIEVSQAATVSQGFLDQYPLSSADLPALVDESATVADLLKSGVKFAKDA